MNKKIEYTTLEERQSILDQNQDLFLISEANITEGNYLVFSDVTPPENPPIEIIDTVELITIPKAEYETLQNQLLLSENKNVEGDIF